MKIGLNDFKEYYQPTVELYCITPTQVRKLIKKLNKKNGCIKTKH